MKQANEHLLTVALREVTKVPELIKSPAATKTYTSYLAALGPDIRMCGLLPALADYSNEKGDAKQKKPPLLRYLQNVLVEVKKTPLPPPKKEEKPVEEKVLNTQAGMRNSRGVGLKVVGTVELTEDTSRRNKTAKKNKSKALTRGDEKHSAALFHHAADLTGEDLADFQYQLEAAIVAGKMALRTFAHKDYKNNRNDG